MLRNFQLTGSTPTEMQSIRENDFECFAGTGLNNRNNVTEFFVNLDFPEADFQGLIRDAVVADASQTELDLPGSKQVVGLRSLLS
jgi:hypothetical protein